MSRALLALALVVSLAPQNARTQDAGGTPRPGPLMHLDLVAADRKGRAVTDLKADDVEIWIGGYRIPIETFGLRTQDQRSITLLIDDITLTPVGLARAKEVARTFVERMGAGDQMAVVALSGDATTAGDDPAALTRRIDGIRIPAAGFLRPDDLSAHVLTTLASIARQVGEAAPARRAVVAIGAGWLFDTPIPPPTIGRELRPEWTEAVRAMAAAHVTLYVIDPGGLGLSRPPIGNSGFARDLGGHAFHNTNDFRGAVDRIMRETVQYYEIGVLDPPVFRKAEVRELEVKVRRRDVTLGARRFITGGAR